MVRDLELSLGLVQRKSLSAAAVASLFAILAVTPAESMAHEAGEFDDASALAYSQAAIGRVVGDHAFIDASGNGLRLADYRGKPLVVNLIYTGCTHTCPLIVEALYRAVDVAQEALGPDKFSVVTVGFDTRNDTPERMRAYARTRGVDLPNWGFLSTDVETMDRLARDLGFIFFPSPKGFDHLAQTTIIDAEGRVYGHVYGAEFGAPTLVEPLKQLVFRRAGNLATLSDLIDRVRLFCTFYDPASERYRFDYSIFIGMIIGFASLSGLGVLLVRGWLRERHLRRGS
jgi:protein SCO1/2